MSRVEAIPAALYQQCRVVDSEHPLNKQIGRIVHVCPIRQIFSVAFMRDEDTFVDVVDCTPQQIAGTNTVHQAL